MRALALVLVLGILGAASQAHARPWRVLKDHWTEADEQGFGAFVQAIGETGCSSSESCLRNPANPYRRTDQAFIDIDVDCAKLPYLLRAYYAWKNGLPFSYVDSVAGVGGDLRYAKSANRPTGRHDIIDHGHGVDAPEAIRTMLSSVYSGTYRTDVRDDRGVLSDFYSPALQPGTIRRGTIVYDVNGHVGIVYKIDADGRIYYMDAHPDFSITRSVYGAQFGQSPMELGGGFKNWRPFRLVGAHADDAGHLIGGHTAFAKNDQIPEFSLVQYIGTKPNASEDVGKARYVYNGARLGFYEYVRAAVSGGRTSYNPVYELQVTMQTLCNDLKDREQAVEQAAAERMEAKLHPSRLPDDIYNSGDQDWEAYATPARDTRLRAAFAQFYRDLAGMIHLWIKRDPRVVYDGSFLKDDLERTYAEESQACTITYLNSGQHPVTMTFDDIAHRLFRMSFDPYDCIELRWGAVGDEQQSCTDGQKKRRWYESEQHFRDETGADYDVAETGDNHRKPSENADDPPPVDIKALIDSMGERTPFQAMTPVGR